MAIQDDFSINYGTKVIDHISGTTVYTVQDFYTWLQDTFDEATQMDDQVPMAAPTGTSYEMLNGWLLTTDTLKFLKGGSIDKATDPGWGWSNFYSLGTIVSGTNFYLYQGLIGLSDPVAKAFEITQYWSTGHVDLIVDTASFGDPSPPVTSTYTLYARNWGHTYDFYTADLSVGGRTPFPFATTLDLNITESEATVATWNDITITPGTVSKDLNNGNGSKNYDVVIDCAGRPLSQVYQYLQYACRRDSTVSGAGETYTAADPTYTPVKAAPFGTFAGGKFFGARGIWIENYDALDASNFQLIASDETTQIPPIVVPIRITSVVSGDRCAVFRLTAPAGSINKDEYTITTANSGESTITVSTTIAEDIPPTGTLRVGDVLLDYASFAGSVFTMTASLGATYSGSLYVPLIDTTASSSTVSTSVKYLADIPVVVRVRKKGIQPFEVESTVTSTGLSVAAIRTTDNVVVI